MMDTTEDRNSTASSVSGVYRNILQSPAPICMFYFSHPFGISTPVAIRTGDTTTATTTSSSSSATSSSVKYRQQQSHPPVKNTTTKKTNEKLIRQIAQEKCCTQNNCGGEQQHRHDLTAANSIERKRLESLIPWPKDTWQREHVMPPIVQLLAKQRGENLPDLEAILNTIQQAWNTPYNRSLLNSRAYDDTSISSSQWDLLSTRNSYSMGSGTYASIGGGSSAGPGGLMRRRYSVPEIIMRKHSLSQQKSYEETIISTPSHGRGSTSRGGGGCGGRQTPTPPSQSRSTTQYKTQTSGSDSNLSRGISGGGGGGSCNFVMSNGNLSGNGSGGEISMRKSTLLRRIWSKELQKHDVRSGSWSPPLRRTHRRLHHYDKNLANSVSFGDGHCAECRKLADDYQTDASPKRLRLTTTSTIDTTVTTNNSEVTESRISSSQRETTGTTTTTNSTTEDSPTEKSNYTTIPRQSSNHNINKNNGDDNDRVVAQGERKNVFIYMTSTESISDYTIDSAQDILRVEIENEPVHPGDQPDTTTSTDSGNHEGTDSPKSNAHEKYRRQINDDQYISRLLIDNLNNSVVVVNNNVVGDDDNDNRKNNNYNLEPSESRSSDSVDSVRAIANKMNNNENVTYVNSKSEFLNKKSNNFLASGHNNNNIQGSEISSVYVASELIEDLVSAHQSEDNFVYGGKLTNVTGVHFAANSEQHPIYFPQYSPESRGDLSSHTSIASEPDPHEIVQVGTGSVYPFNGLHLVIIPRLSAIPRTESMEVQASALEDNDDDRHSIDSISLVDSLEDRGSPHPPHGNDDRKNNHRLSPTGSLKEISQISMDDQSGKTPRDKGESFFVPITDEYDIMDEQLVVSESMPMKLRARLQRRHMELDAKREMEYHKHHFTPSKENLKHQGSTNKSHSNANKSSIIVLDEPTIVTSKPESIQTNTTNGVQKPPTKPRKGDLRELGLLESYTIDAKGNMQFGNGKQVIENSAIKILPPVANTTNINAVNTSTTNNQVASIRSRPPNVVTTKKVQSQKEIIKVKRSEKTTTSSRDHQKRRVTKDVQSLTLYQSQNDLTPDIEGGPRRRYQKTEIQDNGKRIEILEIVECIDSPPDTSPSRPRSYQKISRTLNVVPSKKSMIPMPVQFKPKSADKNKSMKQKNSSIRVIPNSSQNHHGGKVDRAIADLLIGAINNPEQAGVEVVQSPKDVREKGGRKVGHPRHKVLNQPASTMSRRNVAPTVAPVNITSRPYMQKFEVIPEERSSMSAVDSSNDERTKTKIKSKKGEISNNNKMTSKTHSKTNNDRFIVMSSSDNEPVIQVQHQQKIVNDHKVQHVNATATNNRNEAKFCDNKKLKENHSNSNNNSNNKTTSKAISELNNQTEPFKAFDVINNNNNDNVNSSSNNFNNSSYHIINDVNVNVNNNNNINNHSASNYNAASYAVNDKKTMSPIQINQNSQNNLNLNKSLSPKNTRQSPKQFIDNSDNDENMAAQNGQNQGRITTTNGNGKTTAATTIVPTSRGKEALEREDSEPKAWLGFFKRHDGSSLESLIEEDSFTPHSTKTTSNETKTTKSDEKSTKNRKSKQHEEIYSSSIITTTTITTAATTVETPATITSLENNYASSSGSTAKHKRTVKDSSKSICTDYLTECLNKENCLQCKISTTGGNGGDHKSHKDHSKKSNSTTTKKKNGDQKQGCDCIERGMPLKSSDTNVWQVCGSNDCELIKLRLDEFENDGLPQTSETEPSTINSNSFTVFRDEHTVKKETERILRRAPHSRSSFDENQIICHDQEHEKKHMNGGDSQRSGQSKVTLSPNRGAPKTTGRDKSPSKSNGNKKKEPTPEKRENCSDCCFCNPNIHSLKPGPSGTCNFCKKKRTPKADTANPRIDIDESSNFNDTARSSNLSYEIMSKSDHVHTKTKIHSNSEVSSTKCTKTNQKIKRSFLPDPNKSTSGRNRSSSPYSPKSNFSSSSTDLNNKNKSSTGSSPHVNRPKKRSGSIPRTKSFQAIHKIVKDDVDLSSAGAYKSGKGSKNTNTQNTKSSSKISSNFRLPSSPYGTNTINNNSINNGLEASSTQPDYDTSSSLGSSNSSMENIADKMLVANVANRWRHNAHQNQKRRWMARQKEATSYDQNANTANKGKWGSNTDANKTAPGNNANQGWSVTVAGNCCTEMAPDVEMRLSFPNQIKYESFRGVKQYTSAAGAVTGAEDDQDYYLDDYNNSNRQQPYQFGRRLDHHQMAHNRQSLPPAGPAVTGGMMMMLGTGNENPRRSLMKINDRHNVTNYNLPEVFPNNNQHPRQMGQGQQNSNSQMVTRQKSRNQFKKIECSVATATRTISNVNHRQQGPIVGQRAMSYQSIHIPDTGRQTSRDSRRRDQSVDMGTISSRRMSFDSHTPSADSLSVMGNAIAPKVHPKVPTMSERDLTRRHSSCFTRNRAFLT